MSHTVTKMGVTTSARCITHLYTRACKFARWKLFRFVIALNHSSTFLVLPFAEVNISVLPPSRRQIECPVATQSRKDF